MRVILVGSEVERADLRRQLAGLPITIAGEFPTLAAARASPLAADAFVMAHDDASPSPEPLTPREIQVLELLAEGLSNRHIAERLGISAETAKFHLAAASGKLGASNRTDVVRRAVQRGLISL